MTITHTVLNVLITSMYYQSDKSRVVIQNNCFHMKNRILIIRRVNIKCVLKDKKT